MNYDEVALEGEWRAVEGSDYFNSPKLYKENGFKTKEDAQKLIDDLMQDPPVTAVAEKVERQEGKEKSTAFI